MWCGGTHPASALPHGYSHSNIHVSMVLLQTLWPTLMPSTASLWLSCTISQDLNPIQCRGSARKGNSLIPPTQTAQGRISNAELTATRLSGDRRETISFTYYPGAAHMAEKMTRKWQSTSFFPPKQRRGGHSQENQCKIPSDNSLQHSMGS